MTRPRITVLIPCKNEQRNIAACIESVRSLADEILVADSGSSDATLEIVRQQPDCRLIEREFVSYADFKNWAIPQARHEWVLLLDADERVTPALADEIRQVLSRVPASVDGFWIGFHCYFMGYRLRFCGWNTPACRLIRRDRCRYADCRVHEEVQLPSRRTRRLRQRLEHFSFWSYDEYFAKYVRYTALGAQDRWERGERSSYGGLLLRPICRFLQLYLLRLGFLDGLAGLQICMLTAFFNTFVKQARLWERQYVQHSDSPDHRDVPSPPPVRQARDAKPSAPRRAA